MGGEEEEGKVSEEGEEEERDVTKKTNEISETDGRKETEIQSEISKESGESLGLSKRVDLLKMKLVKLLQSSYEGDNAETMKGTMGLSGAGLHVQGLSSTVDFGVQSAYRLVDQSTSSSALELPFVHEAGD